MSKIDLQNVGVLHPKPLFEKLTFSVGDGDRVGLVGINGSGKSTLLRCLTGEIEPTDGKITRARNLSIGVVEQNVPPEIEHLSLQRSIWDSIDPVERSYSEWRVDLLLDSLRAPESLRQKPISALSGGWKRLALIARAWIKAPDLLILDEPTNHLDLAKIVALEDWLNGEARNTATIVASHDRRFLENCTNRTLFLRRTHARSYSYPYSKARELLVADDKSLELHVAKEIRELERLRQSAHELRQIGVNRYSDAALRKSNQIAKRAEERESSLPQLHVEQKRDIKLGNRSSHAKVVARLDKVEVTTPDGKLLFRIGELAVRLGDRIVLLGANGTGKTQLVRLLHRSLQRPGEQVSKGITTNPTTVLGYIDQDLAQLPGDESLDTFIQSSFKLDRHRTTGLLVSAGFAVVRHMYRISSLSPGEQARLTLLALRLSEPNFYLLDEPTNHLDIEGQEHLEREILDHDATCILVSHDREFVKNVGNRFLLIDGNRLVEIKSPEKFYSALLADNSATNKYDKSLG